jgi:hypothetical protein
VYFKSFKELAFFIQNFILFPSEVIVNLPLNGIHNIFKELLSLKYKTHFLFSQTTFEAVKPKTVFFGVIGFLVSNDQKVTFFKNVSQI